MKASQATRRWTAIIAAGAAVIGVSAAAGYWLGQSRGSGTKLEAREADEAVLYWYDPMAVSYTHLDVYKRQAEAVRMPSQPRAPEGLLACREDRLRP